MQGHGRIIAHDFCVAHREANSGLSPLNRTKSILSIYHQQRQLHNQRGMCLNDTYPFCQQPLSDNCHSICFSKPVLWTATTSGGLYFLLGWDSNGSGSEWSAGGKSTMPLLGADEGMALFPQPQLLQGYANADLQKLNAARWRAAPRPAAAQVKSSIRGQYMCCCRLRSMSPEGR